MEESESLDKDCSLKKKIFNIIQIGDKSNRISRAFDIFITITIVLNILVTFAQTFDELSRITMGLKAIEYVTLGIFCVEYVLRIWTAEYLYPNIGRRQAKLRFLISFDGVIDLLTIVPVFFLSGFVIFHISGASPGFNPISWSKVPIPPSNTILEFLSLSLKFIL